MHGYRNIVFDKQLTMLTMVTSSEYWKMILLCKYQCKKINFTTVLWIIIFSLPWGKLWESLWYLFFIFFGIQNIWLFDTANRCGGRRQFITLICLQRIQLDKSVCSLKMKIILPFQKYIAEIENYTSGIIVALKIPWLLLVLVTFWGPVSNYKTNSLWLNYPQTDKSLNSPQYSGLNFWTSPLADISAHILLVRGTGHNWGSHLHYLVQCNTLCICIYIYICNESNLCF